MQNNQILSRQILNRQILNRQIIRQGLWLLLSMLIACGGDPKKKSMHRKNQMFNEVSSDQKCTEIKNPEPFVIRWDGGQRSQLEANLRRGLIFVSYSGCQLKVLRDCRLPTAKKYAYAPWSPKKEEYRIKDVNELYLKLPFNAIDLEADLKANEEFVLSTVFAGYYEDESQEKYKKLELVGDDCELVTHVISRLYIGAFELSAAKDNTKGVKAKVRDYKGGIKSGTAESLLAKDGVMDDCFSGNGEKAHPRCSSMVKIEMTSIDQSYKDSHFRSGICPTAMVFDQEKKSCVHQSTSRFVQLPQSENTQGQDGQQEIGQKQQSLTAVQANGRYVLQGEVVFDSQTGLSWQQMVVGQLYDWKTAKAYCASLQYQGKPWRLPKVNELKSLVDLSQPAAKIDPVAFPQTAPKIFWSSTPDSSTPGEAMGMDFHLGKAEAIGIATKKYVRCVSNE